MLTHFNKDGSAKMVEVSDKKDTKRIAVASGKVTMQPETVALIKDRKVSKGDVLSVAQVAGIMGAKRTSDLVPMCHPLMLTGVDLTLTIEPYGVYIESRVKTVGKTGVEMEALTAVNVAALTVYDMVKAVDKTMTITDICVEHKEGGKSGVLSRIELLKAQEEK